MANWANINTSTIYNLLYKGIVWEMPEALDKVLGPLIRPELRDMVMTSIINAIAAGYIRPGELLLEGELAQSLNVSRSPIREALSALHNAGIVNHIPRKGWCVAPITGKDVEEICSLRAVVESLAAKVITTTISEEQIAELEILVQEMENATTWREKVEKDFEFHGTICKLSNYKRLNKIWEVMAVETRMMIACCKAHGLPETIYVGVHREILDALRTRDPDLVVQKVNEHHQAARKLFLEVL